MPNRTGSYSSSTGAEPVRGDLRQVTSVPSSTPLAETVGRMCRVADLIPVHEILQCLSHRRLRNVDPIRQIPDVQPRPVRARTTSDGM